VLNKTAYKLTGIIMMHFITSEKLRAVRRFSPCPNVHLVCATRQYYYNFV